MDTEFTKLLLDKYLEWQKEMGGRKTLKDFADYVGVGKVAMNITFNGQRAPSKSIVKKLAEIFEDQRFYDAAGMIRPDPRLEYVQRNWGKASPEVQRQIAEMFRAYTTEQIPDEGKTETS